MRAPQACEERREMTAGDHGDTTLVVAAQSGSRAAFGALSCATTARSCGR